MKQPFPSRPRGLGAVSMTKGEYYAKLDRELDGLYSEALRLRGSNSCRRASEELLEVSQRLGVVDRQVGRKSPLREKIRRTEGVLKDSLDVLMTSCGCGVSSGFKPGEGI